MLLEKLENLRLRKLTSPVRRGFASVVDIVKIYTFLDQILDHFKSTELDCVINWSLSISINDIKISSCVKKLSTYVNVSFSHSVIDWRLSIGISMINIRPRAYQMVNDLCIS
jgi:hypothetical protein